MRWMRRLKRRLLRQRGKEGAYARIEGPQLLDHQAREQIVNVLKRDPGLSFHEIQGVVGLAPGTTKWHLDKLRTSRFVSAKRDGRHTRYYPTGMDPRTMKAVVAVRDPSRLAIIRMILRNPGITQADLCKHTALAQSTVSHHIRRLSQDGLIATMRDGRSTRYAVVDDMEKPVNHAVGYVM